MIFFGNAKNILGVEFNAVITAQAGTQHINFGHSFRVALQTWESSRLIYSTPGKRVSRCHSTQSLGIVQCG